MTVPKIILDTDFSSDIDDAGDVAVTLTYHRMGFANLIGVITDTTRAKGPGAIQALMLSRGVSGVPIGSYQPGSTFDPNPGSANNYPDYLYDNFTHTGVALSASCTDSTTQYRTLLAAAAANSVTIVCTGFLTAIDALLLSPADGISGLTGAQLVAAKCKAAYIVAGVWPNSTTAEYNLAQAPAAGNRVITNWPSTVPLCFVGVELGNAAGVTGTTIDSALSAGDALRTAYTQAGYDVSGRTCWGQLGVMCAVEDEAGFKRVRGTAAINGSTGDNTFVASSTGPHYYFTFQYASTGYAAKLEQLLVANPSVTPPITTWSGGAFLPATIV